MKTLIKLPFKILALSLVPTLFILGFALTFLGWLSGRVLAFASLLFGIGGAVILFQGDAYGGIGLLVIAFLISPFGLPAVAEAIANIFHMVNGSIIGFIAG